MKMTNEQLEQRMQEAVWLPHEDPRRLEVLAAIAEAGEWAEQRWLELVLNDEKLRLRLRHVQPPPGMEQRLQSLTPASSPYVLLKIWRYAGAMAAVIALALGGVWFFSSVNRPGGTVAGSFDAFGRLAVEHYVLHKTASEPDDPTPVEQAQAQLTKSLPFEVKLPPMPQGFKLIGSSPCPLGESAVACTRWVREGRLYILYQFRVEDYRLSKDFTPLTVRSASQASTGQPLETRFWTQGKHAYALVAEQGAMIELAWRDEHPV